MKIIESRNKREGGYSGRVWRYNISRGRINARNRRSGPHGYFATLREIARNLRPF